jgi:hypothetical protein
VISRVLLLTWNCAAQPGRSIRRLVVFDPHTSQVVARKIGHRENHSEANNPRVSCPWLSLNEITARVPPHA